MNVSIAAVHVDENALAMRSPDNGNRPRRGTGAGTRGYVDGSPSQGRVRKAARADGALSSNPLFTRQKDDIYETVVDKASMLFAVIRQTVVCELAPSALKSAFLDPLHSSLFNEVLSSVCCTSCMLLSEHASIAVLSVSTSGSEAC